MEIVTRCLFWCHLKHLILGQSLWRDGIFVIITVHVTNYLLFSLYFIQHWCMFFCLSLLLCCFKSGDSNVFANSQKNWHSLFSAAFHPIMSIFNAMSLPDATSLMLYLHGWPEGWIINTPVYPYRLGGACTQHDLAEQVKAAPSSPAGAAFIGAKRTYSRHYKSHSINNTNNVSRSDTQMNVQICKPTQVHTQDKKKVL